MNYENDSGIETPSPDRLPEPEAQRAANAAPVQLLQEHRRDIVRFFASLMVFVKQCRAYPPEHPAIAASSAETLALLTAVLTKREELTVGVARRGLFIGKSVMQPENRQFQLFASLLYDHGIATLTFTREVTAGDAKGFARLLQIQPSRLWEKGGPEAYLAHAGIAAIRVTRVSSDMFRLVEEAPASAGDEEALDLSLWEAMIRSLAGEGLLPGVGGDMPDARGLAHLLADAAASREDFAARLEGVQQNFLGALPPRLVVYSARSLEKITSFVRELSPRVRKLFLMNMFGGSQRVEFVEALVAQLPTEEVLDALKAADSESYVPPLVQRLLVKLASTSAVPPEQAEATEKGESILQLFRPDQLEKFVPEPYRHTLVSVLSAESLPGYCTEQIVSLRRTLEHEAVESGIASVIFELISGDPREDMLEGLQRNLCDIATYFLETGDFLSLRRLAEKARGASPHPAAAGLVREVEDFFASPHFTDRLFDSLALWGKEKREETTDFIRKIGDLIIPAILDRLAEEENMSLRRYYIERLAELGPPARDAAIARLSDSRWYFVRNLITLLRTINDPQSLEQIRRLSAHPHPRIREEVIRAFGNCGSAIGVEVLLRELSSAEKGRVLKAVRMAESSNSEGVLAKLLEILCTPPLTGHNIELKCAVVRTLAAIGNARAVPVLEEILNSRNLLRPLLLRRLKAEILRNIKRFGIPLRSDPGPAADRGPVPAVYRGRTSNA